MLDSDRELKGIKVYVHLGRGFDARTFERDYVAGHAADRSPYGFHLATLHGAEVAFSEDSQRRLAARLFTRLSRRVFGIDVVHAIENRAAARHADVIWTMTEREAFAIAMLMTWKVIPVRPIVANAVWLYNSWAGLSNAKRLLYRKLARRLSILTVHSDACLPMARKALPSVRCERVFFGVNTDFFQQTAPSPAKTGQAIKVLAAGNDATRDWKTLLKAFGNDQRFELTIVSPNLDSSVAERYTNLRTPKNPTRAEFFSLYREASVVVIPMVDNLFSGITVALEAAILGKPIICSNTGGVPTYFGHDEVLYVPPGEPQALRNATLCAEEDTMLRRALKAQKKFVDNDYSTAALIRSYVRYTTELVGGR